MYRSRSGFPRHKRYWLEQDGCITAFKVRINPLTMDYLGETEVLNALVRFCESSLHPGERCYRLVFYGRPCHWCRGEAPRMEVSRHCRWGNRKRYRVKWSGRGYLEVLLKGERSASPAPVITIRVPAGRIPARNAMRIGEDVTSQTA